ncbi:MAG: ATP-dependent Clp protease proteolytic subunit [Spirochaetes bacterium GWD1_61_31]|nr:MAG: ATP-dependent Clp protease proteolytic subunit [Spirochaetes bacterium GWB1_60_80]OHD43415.1 MAG: ATP-dependent Clp protease proteolytic subunit [Spirochaetes bacterium GWD1_61_31]OHD46602.1 MAG: ATP-dependent Clp protease proteolytic subunit [Spirochaetes bacterium GWE1_60_18]OHD61036.1 MAG: ATP-dependent Clp protease proteolytic subunit [Spirochaetes bacterium GWF1_60_12]HAP44783.1 ATP-dependent Clp protease proteolytic subunit [Spirochaetaceae bacterium]
MKSQIDFRLDDEDDDDDDECGNKAGKSGDALMERMLDTRTIILSGQVDKVLAERVVRQLILLEARSHEPIRIMIDSPGGDVDAGYAIFDMARFINAPVWMIGMGLVASAGALILLAAPKQQRLALPNSHYLIHQPLSGLRGVATDIEIHARELERTRDRINKLIVAETGQSLERVVKDTDRDYWMNAEEAVAYGLVSRVVRNRSELTL